MKNRPEEVQQTMVVNWFRRQYPALKNLLFIIANGENVGAIRMNKLKAMGLVPGMPDLMLAVTSSQDPRMPGLFIEMKSENGRLQINQKQIHETLGMQGYKCVTAYGFEQAKQEIEAYLKGVARC